MLTKFHTNDDISHGGVYMSQRKKEVQQNTNMPELPEADVVLDSYGTTSLPVPEQSPIYCLTIIGQIEGHTMLSQNEKSILRTYIGRVEVKRNSNHSVR